MGQQEFDRTQFIVRKLWDLKLQIHMIGKEGAQLSDVIGHVITGHAALACMRCLSCLRICIQDDVAIES